VWCALVSNRSVERIRELGNLGVSHVPSLPKRNKCE
jgi:hypothetical protein